MNILPHMSRSDKFDHPHDLLAVKSTAEPLPTDQAQAKLNKMMAAALKILAEHERRADADQTVDNGEVQP